jgi:lipopolysaccharide transport system permease protein
VQALGQLMNVLMFVAPIFYDREQMPERVRGWLDLNPFTFYADAFRAVLLHHGEVSLARIATALAIAAIVLLAGHYLFRRLDPHFEDFL